MKYSAEERRRQELKNKFYEKYKSKLLPMLRSFESDRKRELRKAVFLATSFISLGCIIFCSMFF